MISRSVFDAQLQQDSNEVRFMVAMRDPCYLEPGYVYVHLIRTCPKSEIDALLYELSETHGMAGYSVKYGDIPMFEFKERLTNVTT